MKVNRITLKQYLTMSAEARKAYDLLINSTKSPVRIGLKKWWGWKIISPKFTSLWDYTYSQMIDLKEMVQSAISGKANEIELVEFVIYELYGVPKKLHRKIYAIHYFNCAGWIIEQLTKIVEIEKSELSSEPDAKEKEAGIDSFNRFGDMPTIRMLAKERGESKEKVLSTSYGEIFMDLCYLSTLNKYNKRLSELYSQAK